MGIVWDSATGRSCPLCGQAIKACRCVRKPSSEAGDGIIRLRIEKSGRKGKTVTVITGLPLEQINAICKAIKKCCGAGGSVKDGSVEIQGDHRDTIRAELKRRSLPVRA